MVPPTLSVVCSDAELAFPMDLALSDLLLYLTGISMSCVKASCRATVRVIPGGMMADGSAVPWLVLEQLAGGAGRGGIEEVLDRAGEDKVGSKELFCS